MTVGPSLQDGDHVVHQGLLAVALHRRWVSVSRRVNDLGAKIGQFADDRRKSYGTSRDEVYRIFTEYERWKNSQDLYDRMDLVSSIHRRLSDTPYKQRDAVKIDSMSVDEVQDFTQVGFTSPSPGQRPILVLAICFAVAICFATQAELCLYLQVLENPNDIMVQFLFPSFLLLLSLGFMA